MKALKINTDSDHWILVFLADLHEGPVNQAERELKHTISRIENLRIKYPKAHIEVHLVGDLMDCVLHHDKKRFNPVEVHPKYAVKDLKNLPKKQTENIFKTLEPIKNIITTSVIGNHEASCSKYYSYDPYNELCDMLEMPEDNRLGLNGVVRIASKRTTRSLMLQHGISGGGMKPGYPINTVCDSFIKSKCDINIQAHIHKFSNEGFDKIDISPYGNIVQRKQFFGSTGCYLRSNVEGSISYGDSLKGELPGIGCLVYEMNASGSGVWESLTRWQY